MSIDPVKQITLLVYEYLYHKGLRIEKAYYDEIDRYYKQVYKYRHTLVDREDMLRLIELETAFKIFSEVQKEIFDILRSYDNYDKERTDKQG